MHAEKSEMLWASARKYPHIHSTRAVRRQDGRIDGSFGRRVPKYSARARKFTKHVAWSDAHVHVAAEQTNERTSEKVRTRAPLQKFNLYCYKRLDEKDPTRQRPTLQTGGVKSEGTHGSTNNAQNAVKETTHIQQVYIIHVHATNDRSKIPQNAHRCN